jgi:hypothetical protein
MPSCSCTAGRLHSRRTAPTHFQSSRPSQIVAASSADAAAGFILFCQRSFLIPDELPAPTGKPCWNIPSLAGNIRARSYGPLCRGALRQRGARERRDRETLQRVDANRLPCAFLPTGEFDFNYLRSLSFRNQFLQFVQPDYCAILGRLNIGALTMDTSNAKRTAPASAAFVATNGRENSLFTWAHRAHCG